MQKNTKASDEKTEALPCHVAQQTKGVNTIEAKYTDLNFGCDSNGIANDACKAANNIIAAPVYALSSEKCTHINIAATTCPNSRYFRVFSKGQIVFETTPRVPNKVANSMLFLS